MIFIVLGMIVALYAVKNYRIALCFYIGFKLLLVTNITLLSLPGLPLLTLEDALNIYFVIMFFFKRNKNKSLICYKYELPWQLPFVILFICISVSSILGIASISSEITALIKYSFENFLLIWVMWNVLENKADFNLIIKIVTVVMFLSCLYGFVEYIIQYNPLQLYEATLNNDVSKAITFTYSTTERGYRVNSIFSHAIGAGMNWGIYSSFVLYKYIQDKKAIPWMLFSEVTAILCLVCLLLTKMRSPILFFAISCVGAFRLKKKRSYFVACLFIMGVFAFIVLGGNNSVIFQVVASLFSSATKSMVGGSSLELRMIQLNAALNLISSSPVFGLGTKYQRVLNTSLYSDILGSEGMLLYVLPAYGFVGLFAYINMYMYSIVKLPKYFKSRQLFFLMLGYVMTYLLSSLPGMKMHLLYLFAFYLIKSSTRYRSYDGPKKKELERGKIRFIY